MRRIFFDMFKFFTSAFFASRKVALARLGDKGAKSPMSSHIELQFNRWLYKYICFTEMYRNTSLCRRLGKNV